MDWFRVAEGFMLRTILRKARSFLRQPGFTQLWFIPLWLILGLSRVLILTVPFKRLAPHLGRQTGVNPWVPLANAAQEIRALRIGRAVRLSARYTPWDSNCFAQAVSARLLLGLYGIPYALYFGLMRESQSSEMKAHAWVATGKIPVTGGTSFGQFTVVSFFIDPRLAQV
jgi:hypothetical protein